MVGSGRDRLVGVGGITEVDTLGCASGLPRFSAVVGVADSAEKSDDKEGRDALATV